MRRAQLQAMETIIISIILIVLVIFGLWFYANATIDTAEAQQRELDYEDVEQLAIRLSYLPELGCPEASVDSSVCIDKLKAEILGQWLTNASSDGYTPSMRLHYATVFGTSTIIIEETYPREWNTTVYDGHEDERYIQNSIPVTLYDPFTDSTTLGRITVRT